MEKEEEENVNDGLFTIAMFADMGRGTRDDSKTWHEYGSPAVNVSAALAADVVVGQDVGRKTTTSIINELLHASTPSANDDERGGGGVVGVVGAAFLFGDLSYATGYASVWDEWMEEISPWASRVPSSTWVITSSAATPRRGPPDSPGDLYSGGDSGGECGIPATRLFPTPAATTAAAAPTETPLGGPQPSVHSASSA